MPELWEGFWQVLHDSVDEEVVSFRDTTIALRPATDFVVLSRRHFIEIGQRGRRLGPSDRPLTQPEAVTMFKTFHLYAGRCDWRKRDDHWVAEESIMMATDPRLEGTNVKNELDMDGDQCLRRKFLANGTQVQETWRRLSKGGTSRLAGAWESEGPENRWIYLVTAGHYGVVRESLDRQRTPSHGKEFTDDELYTLSKGCSGNAGAHLETSRTFDHWPMISNGAPGFEARKHPTFHIESLERDRLVFSIPLRVETNETWHRID